MGRKITNIVLFLTVIAAAVAMTLFVGQGATGMTIYNFVFLGIMAMLYLAGMILGMFKMNSLSSAFSQATEDLVNIFKAPGKKDLKSLEHLKDIFDNAYLDSKMDSFVSSIHTAEEGIGDIEEYISETEIDLHIHKRLLEMVPDILTSLGILGTFVGLVWGLKSFEPNNYEAMTNSVSVLVEGIKVAFLTSIYGISFSVIYTIGHRSEYSALTEQMQGFLEKFHAHVLPTAENESRNLLVASQKIQTEAVNKMAEQFSVQMAGSFEKVITPTFQKMNESLDILVSAVTRCQQDAIRDIVDVFIKEMHGSLGVQFNDFAQIIEKMKKAQQDNTEYSRELYQNLSKELSDTYIKQEKAMKDIVNELIASQNRFMNTATSITRDNQLIQKMQQQDYQNVTDYMKEAEQSAAKFWVACNQTMKRYVETAVGGMEAANASTATGKEVLKSNQQVMSMFDSRMKDFTEYQKQSHQTMEQVRRLLSDIAVNNSANDVRLSTGRMNDSTANGTREALLRIEKLLAAQAENEKELFEQLNESMKEMAKTSQKGRGGLFR